LKVNTDVLEIVMQTGGELENPIFENEKMFKIPFNLSFASSNPKENPRNSKNLLSLLKQAIIDSLVDAGSIKRVALLLSGGVDSSLLLRLVKDVYPELDVTAYHTVFGTNDELKYAKLAAKHANTPIESVDVSPIMQAPHVTNALLAVKTVSYSTVPVYLAMKRIAESNHDIVLNALGLDELFAGYTIHKRFLIKRPAVIPFIRWSNSYYRHAGSRWGTDKAFILYNTCIIPSSRLVKDSSYDPDEFYNSLKRKTLWDTIQTWTIKAMQGTFASLMTRAAEVFDLQVVFPYMNEKLMRYALSLRPEIKKNKAPIRFIMRHILKMPEEIVRRGENWDKMGWGAIPLSTYYSSDQYMRSITPSRIDTRIHYWFTNVMNSKFWKNGRVPNRVGLQILIFLKLLELNEE